MSEWYEATEGDIDVDQKIEEVIILVTANEWGNIYTSLTFQQIVDIYNEINKGA